MPQNNAMVPAPIVLVKKEGQYTVKNFYLEDLTKLNKVIKMLIMAPWLSPYALASTSSKFLSSRSPPPISQEPKIDYDNATISDDLYKMALHIILVLKSFAGDRIAANNSESEMLATVLIFLPGINEIMKMHTVLTDYMKA